MWAEVRQYALAFGPLALALPVAIGEMLAGPPALWTRRSWFWLGVALTLFSAGLLAATCVAAWSLHLRYTERPDWLNLSLQAGILTSLAGLPLTFCTRDWWRCCLLLAAALLCTLAWIGAGNI